MDRICDPKVNPPLVTSLLVRQYIKNTFFSALLKGEKCMHAQFASISYHAGIAALNGQLYAVVHSTLKAIWAGHKTK